MPVHASPKGLPAPPSLPSIPHQLPPGERINQRVRQINDKWNLGIRIRDSNYSPTKSSPNDIANKIYGHIQHLTYRNEPALKEAIDDFDNRAKGLQHQECLVLLNKLLSDVVKKCATPSKARTQDVSQPRSLTSSLRGRYTFSFTILYRYLT